MENLNVHLLRDRSFVPVLSDVSFGIEAQSIVGLSGDSGCGKSTLARALLRLLPAHHYRWTGSVQLSGRELMSLRERELEAVRGAQVALIFQDPLLALNPVMRVKRQVAEVMQAHRPARKIPIEELLELAGIPAGPRVLDAYPHQLSGGERQRITIAQALACRPALIIADEPFTALDGLKVLELTGLFRRLKETLGTSFLLIAHHPGILARIADRVLVMKGGRIAA